MDQRSFLHPFTSVAEHDHIGPRVISAGKGVRITDSHGKEYLDAMAGLWCVNVGYGREEIAAAMAEQSRKLCYYHSFLSNSNAPAIEIAERITRLYPGLHKRAFFGNSGSDANDTNIKLVWYYNNLLGRPERKKIISRRSSYHGVMLGSASLSGLPHLHASFDLPVNQRFLQVATPHYYRHAAAGMAEAEFVHWLAEDLEQTIEREDPSTIAAFIAEPVMGAGGVLVPPAGYFEAIVPILRRYDILFIVDEVICGFGRLGKMFGAEQYGLEPDIVTLAKGLTSGYAPLSASLISERICEVLADHSQETGPFAHGLTYTAHPMCAAAALANLDLFEKEDLVANAASVGAYLQERLRSNFAEHPLVGEVRGIGMIAGIELVKDKRTKESFDPKLAISRRLHELLLNEGLVCRPIANMLAFSPPLILKKSEVDEIVEKFGRGLANLADGLVRDGLWRSAG
jgi:adenosylmethionine-8-amino-7-oxononanoate aminotransferase